MAPVQKEREGQVGQEEKGKKSASSAVRFTGTVPKRTRRSTKATTSTMRSPLAPQGTDFGIRPIQVAGRDESNRRGWAKLWPSAVILDIVRAKGIILLLFIALALLVTRRCSSLLRADSTTGISAYH